MILISITSPAQIHTEKAVVLPSHIDTIIELEKVFAANDSTPPSTGSMWFKYKSGSKKILFIAAHATAQIRENHIKQPDAGTGSMAEALNIFRKVPVLYTTYLSPSDPNFYDNNEFKDSLRKILDIVKPILVVDLHGSHPYRPYDIDFGTMNGQSLLNKTYFLDSLSFELYTNGLINQSINYFPAMTNQTITKFVSAYGYPCIQLEINSNYLLASKGDTYAQKTAQLLQALFRLVDDF